MDLVADKLARPPRWLTDHGLEWLGRLLVEPRRLWRRYLVGNPLFLWRVLGQRLGWHHLDDDASPSRQMNLLGRLVDNRDQDSVAAKLRRVRFSFFLSLLQNVPRPVTILDVGGTQGFWETMGYTDVPGVQVTLLNLDEQPVRHSNFSSLVGDATDLSEIRDAEFDVVFSNSVIEHVGGLSQQGRMAREIQRVGKRYFVQTPNYLFPIEPHFLLPGFQWLPASVRVFLVRHFSLGWIRRIPDRDKAAELVHSTRLLRKGELLALFPGARLYEEKVLGLTKSFVVYKGW
jgi:2-polyprenyl-3-methyl-5-hydroxy-6-metoxy-1,4-benzoquinol methylase